MKLHFKTQVPDDLKLNIITAVEEGNLNTWAIHEYDSVKYLKHTGQWSEKGVINLDSDPNNNQLIVNVLKLRKSEQEVKEFQGYYLGRFCELMFNHFWEDFNSIDKK